MARALKSPLFRQRVITGNRRVDRMAAFADMQAMYLEALEADDDDALDRLEIEMREFRENPDVD